MAMDKRFAHFILAIFDIIAIFTVYWVAHRYNNIDFALENGNDVISFNNRFFFYLGILIVPIAHTMAIIEAKAKSFFERYIRKIGNLIYIILVIVFIFVPVLLTSVLKSRLEGASYHYCQIASSHRKISSELVYVKNMQLCTEDLKNYKPVF